MENLIESIKGMNPAVACTLILVAGGVIGIFLWQYFKFLRSL